MTIYYIIRNRQGQIEEVFISSILAQAYAKTCDFILEKIIAPTKGA